MLIKRRGVVLLGPSAGQEPTFYSETLRENFETGVIKSAFQCILSKHGFKFFC